MFGDDKRLPLHIQEAVPKIATCVSSNDCAKYLPLMFESFNTIKGKEGPWYLDQHLRFNGPPSDINRAYNLCLTKCFNKVSYALHGREPDNHSGYYLIGPQGIGKSTLLRTCCLLGGLLPNFVPVYIDCSAKTTDSPPPSVLFAAAITEMTGSDSLELNEDLGMTGILGYATKHKLALGLFIDEIQEVYTPHNKTWNEIHVLVDGFRSAVFATGSDSKIRMLVEAKNRRLIKTIKGFDALQDLNGKKLEPLDLIC